jgi:hypothetical protein
MPDPPVPPRKKKVGRPPLDAEDPSVKVCVTLPGRRYDALYQRAAQARMGVPELIRRVLARVITDDQ